MFPKSTSILEGKDLTKMWVAAPQWAVVICIIVGFLYYLDRREQREVEREQRMESAISDVADALREQARTLDRLQIIIEAHR